LIEYPCGGYAFTAAYLDDAFFAFKAFKHYADFFRAVILRRVFLLICLTTDSGLCWVLGLTPLSLLAMILA
jgi:hypothetical protein